MSDQPGKPTLLNLAAKIITAHVSHNAVSADALPDLIRGVFMALATAGGLEVPAEKEEPRVSARRSVFADHLVCMECGLSFKMIKRHLGNDHAMTPDSYRAKWGLPRDYPMVAAEYSALRAEVARATGLGRRRAPPMAEPAVVHLLERTRVRPGTAD